MTSTRAELLANTAGTPLKDVLICDTECYPNFWSIGFLRLRDGKVLVMEHSERKPFTEADRARLYRIMTENRIITYNGLSYDMPMIFLAIDGADNATLKRGNDRIIVGGMKYWHARDVLGVDPPRNLDHIDLIEPQPNAFAGLKTLAGRLHAPFMQDLPHHPDTPLTHEQMDEVLSYMGNDLRNTHIVFDALEEPLALRRALSEEYRLNLMSKSDAQVGEAIIKRRVEQATGRRVEKVETPAGTEFQYPIPSWLKFERDDLNQMLDRLREHNFIVQHNGKVDLPEWLAHMQITIGQSVYQMGIGGLHSTEKNRALHSDDERVLVDFDVASYYPAIIINSGLYPRALGPDFLTIYRQIRDERVVAKRAGNKVKAEGLKIALNGCFGKLGSPYSILYAPHLMITVTLTGQLALLMLIERAERAGFPIVSANTDGVVFSVAHDLWNGMAAGGRVHASPLADVIEQWERDTGFELEANEYRSIYNQSVNSYIAIKADGKAKWKGPIANPWRADDGWKPDLRGQMMKNPQMPIVANAVVDLILYGKPIEQTIRASRDVRDFVTVVKVDGGATWRGEYLGKVVRYIWATGGCEILKAKPHKSTGNFGMVPKSDGCRPLMQLPDEFPDDIDYAAYERMAREVLMDIGYDDRPPPIKPIRIWKHTALAWFALAV